MLCAGTCSALIAVPGAETFLFLYVRPRVHDSFLTVLLRLPEPLPRTFVLYTDWEQKAMVMAFASKRHLRSVECGLWKVGGNLHITPTSQPA